MSNTPLAYAPKKQFYELKSPDENIALQVEASDKLQWSVQHKGEQIIQPSSVSLQLENGEVLGDHAKVKSSETRKVNTEIKAINYRRAVIKDQYHQLIIHFENDFGIEFRVYNDAVAYRFLHRKRGKLM